MTTDVTDTGVGTIRAGFLGAGFMGRVHSRAARAAGADLAELAARSAQSSAHAARSLGITRSVADAGDLLHSEDLDVVHICTPNATHAPYAARALSAGRHVVCEKPLATTAAEARALVEQAHAAGLVAAVPFVYRYHPMVREARARIAAGEIGETLTIDAAYLQDWLLLADDENWRATADDGGPSRAFADIGSHLGDLIEFVSGQRIVRVAARTRRVFAERGGRTVENEDVAAVLFETDGGALGTMLVSQMAPGRKNALQVEFHGSERSIRFAQERPEELWIGQREGSQLILRSPDSSAPDAARLQGLPAGHPMGYQDAFNAFVADVYAAIGGAAPEGMPTFDDGLRAAVLTEAVLLSAASREWVEVAG